MERRGGIAALAAAAAVVALSGCAGCQSKVSQSSVRQASLPLIAAGSFDGVAADQGSHRLYLADRTNSGVDVVDRLTGCSM